MENKKNKTVRYFETKNDEVKSESKLKPKKNKNNDKAFENADVIEIRPNTKRAKYRHKTFNQKKKIGEKKNKYPGKTPIPKELIEKYTRGEASDGKGVVHPRYLKTIKRAETKIKFAARQAARTELLLPEDTGHLEAEEGETTRQYTQKEIADNVDIATAAKHFELNLNKFGPYRMRYSRNGRHLLLGGKMGHVASFDWITKNLHCEINVMESVHDVCWLHNETMFGVAQKDWVYIYDKKGTEVHSLKNLYKILRMEFLPYHFLLATASEPGYLSWLDVSIGEMAGQFNANIGRISVMKQNPYNAVLCVGQSTGVVSMWSPTVRKPLARLLCHRSPIADLAVDPRGIYMATAGTDRYVNIWDIRKLHGPLQKYRLRCAPSQIDFSHMNHLAVGMGNVIEVYRNCCTESAEKAYLIHRMNGQVENLSFCPYEDVLGVGTDRGFVSLIVPGSGEPNFDALENNPYQTKSQRRETEVKMLLEKIQPELINLNPTSIVEIDIPTLKERVEHHNKLKQLKPKKVDYTTRRKHKNKGTAALARNKKIVQETENKKFYKEKKKAFPKKHKNKEKTDSFGVLDRFVNKNK